MKKVFFILVLFVLILPVSAEQFIPFDNVENIQIKQDEFNEWKLFCSNHKKITVYYNGYEYSVCELKDNEEVISTAYFEFPFFSSGIYVVKKVIYMNCIFLK